ncbi:MAG: carbohydrate kinase [Victivallaceae bacterium]|nr:carbohydrate kinase [Victivallaceae bacterium]
MAIDVGLSFCKALLFNEAGDVIASASCSTPVLNPAHGFSEINMTHLWELVSGIIRQAVGTKPVAALGVSAHGNGIYCLDSDGNPVAKALTSMDRRAENEINLLSDEQKELLTTRSTQGLWAGQPGMILRWLKHHKPKEYSRIDKVMLCKDYLSFMLTGVYATDWSDISASGLLNNLSGEYDAEMLEAMEISEFNDKLPPVIRAFDIRGGISESVAAQIGIQSGTPVIGGMFDVDASVYGAGITEPGTLCTVAGTWNINTTVIETPCFDPKVRQCIRRGDGQKSMLIDSSATSAVNIEWLLKKFFENNIGYEDFSAELEIYKWDNNSPYWLPFINGSLDTAAQKGALIGLDVSHDSKDMMAAVAEGICFAHRFHIENIAQTGAKFEKIRLTGGAAKDSFCQLFSDICGFPVETVNEKQTGAAGIRLAANVALGKYPDMTSNVTVEREFKPKHNNWVLFNKRYERFKELIKYNL